MATYNQNTIYGSNPISIIWDVVRGDQSTLKVEFLNLDEVTNVDTSTWEFAATVYDVKNDAEDELDVIVSSGYVEIVATPDITENWGSGYGAILSELLFDLQITIDQQVWTPILGSVRVLGDVTGGSL
jgi:hypothetical protein